MSLDGDVSKAVLLIKPSEASAKSADKIRFALYEGGFIVVREEYRDLTAEMATRVTANEVRLNAVADFTGKVYVFVVARTNCATELSAFALTNNLVDTCFFCTTAANASAAVIALFPRMVVDTIPTNAEAREYVQEHLKNVLIKGLTQVAKLKPKNPIDWLADYLLENNLQAPPVEKGPNH
jgi:hypothetical protein